MAVGRNRHGAKLVGHTDQNRHSTCRQGHRRPADPLRHRRPMVLHRAGRPLRERRPRRRNRRRGARIDRSGQTRIGLQAGRHPARSVRIHFRARRRVHGDARDAQTERHLRIRACHPRPDAPLRQRQVQPRDPPGPRFRQRHGAANRLPRQRTGPAFHGARQQDFVAGDRGRTAGQIRKRLCRIPVRAAGGPIKRQKVDNFLINVGFFKNPAFSVIISNRAEPGMQETIRKTAPETGRRAGAVIKEFAKPARSSYF